MEFITDKPEPGYSKTRFGDAVHTGHIQGLIGERGLVLAIIDRARLDFLIERDRTNQDDAARFFLGSDYRHWLQLLGISTNYLPEGITIPRLKYQLAGGL